MPLRPNRHGSMVGMMGGLKKEDVIIGASRILIWMQLARRPCEARLLLGRRLREAERLARRLFRRGAGFHRHWRVHTGGAFE